MTSATPEQLAAHVEAGEMPKPWPVDQSADPVLLPKLPPCIVMHPQLGELFDRLAMHLYAMGYAQDCVRAAIAPKVEAGEMEAAKGDRHA